jgi:hypothetical protein
MVTEAGSSIKVLTEFLLTLLEHMTGWMRHRKPRLHVHFAPGHEFWSVGQEMQRDGTFIETMQMNFSADFTHTGYQQSLIITDAYPKGTTPRVPMMTKFDIPPEVMATEQVSIIVRPVVGKKGKPWTGRIIFVDHYNRKHRSDIITFQWGGN